MKWNLSQVNVMHSNIGFGRLNKLKAQYFLKIFFGELGLIALKILINWKFYILKECL